MIAVDDDLKRVRNYGYDHSVAGNENNYKSSYRRRFDHYPGIKSNTGFSSKRNYMSFQPSIFILSWMCYRQRWELLKYYVLLITVFKYFLHR